MTENKYLRWAFWALAYFIGIVFILCLVTDYLHAHSVNTPRLFGLVLIGIEAWAWIWLTSKRWRTT